MHWHILLESNNDLNKSEVKTFYGFIYIEFMHKLKEKNLPLH
jgi:hypothetical protein